MSYSAERAIFLQAIEEDNLDDRLAYLDSACGSDDELRAAVESLLAAHDRPAALLDHPIGADLSRPSLANWCKPFDHIGMQVDSYKLMELVGEGGFGLVFVAQQEEPVRRKVALKLVKPGLDSAEVLARFEAERQAVAMMNHPHIAQIFDVGVTADHRPYFVMELVRGLPIAEFCDQHQLDVSQRIELMIDVCSAVHHAHQKGVIHRDIKPSNVLVTLHDGKPVAKVIDFGVAKAIGQKLSDKSVYTCLYSMIGTPMYMSPEQAEMSGLDVDTRSDIYSLGVVLYELLVGNTPFDRERLSSAGLDELRRIIREEEPPRPSTRFSTCIQARSTIADQRRINSGDLASILQGDLDWIVMKSLEKERGRRYDSAAALALDLGRFLANEPVDARPPSQVYRLQKFAIRNRVAIVTTTLIGLSLLLGMGLSLWQMSKAIDERNAKDAALKVATQAEAEAVTARRQVELFVEDLTRANELVIRGQANADAGRWNEASEDYNNAVSIQPGYFLPRVQRAQLYTSLGLFPEAAADYAVAVNTGASISQPQWWGVPALFLYTGNRDAYVKMRLQRMEEIQVDPNRPNWMLLRDAVVGPFDSSENYWELILTAENWPVQHPNPGQPKPPRSNQGRPQHPPNNPRRGPQRDRDQFGRPAQRGDTPTSTRLYTLGMLHLRAGEFDTSIELLTEAAQDPRWPSKFLIYAPIALAHFHNGDIIQASEALDKSDTAIQEFQSESEERRLRDPDAPWFDLVEGLQLNREAWQAIRGTPSTLNTALDQRRIESLRLLQGVAE